MDFKEELRTLSLKIQKQRESVETEEAAKNAFVLPFIAILGYDVFDPTEVVPEFTSDYGTKKGEKVDYAIVNDRSVRMIFECKKPGVDLNSKDCGNQLYRYFHVKHDVKVAILTDGIIYRFYSDIDNSNVKDDKPFLEINMLDLQEPLVAALKQFTKHTFNLSEIVSIAKELKYTREIKRILAEEFDKPSDEFVKLFAKQLYSGKVMHPVLEQFKIRVKQACSQYIKERINAVIERASDQIEVDKDPEQIDKTDISSANDEYSEFFRQLLDKSNKLTTLFASVNPTKNQNWVSAGGGKQGFAFQYAITKNNGRAEVWLGNRDALINKRRFELLKTKMNEIESSYGQPLEWDFVEKRNHQYIRSTCNVGGLNDNEKWPQIQEDLVNRMAKLEQALKNHILSLD